MLEGSLPVTDEGTLLARGWKTMLLAVKTCGAPWEILELADSGVQVASVLGMSQDTRPHNELELAESQVAKMVVPAKKFFLGFQKVDVGTADNRDSQRQCSDGLYRVLRTYHHAGR